MTILPPSQPSLQRMARNTRTNRDAAVRKSLASEQKSLAFQVYSCLPREIRNRIYTFCVQGPIDNEVIVRPASSGKKPIALLIRDRCDRSAYQWTEDPFASSLDVDYLGLESARELLEAYYWTRTFKCAEHQLGHLEAFLSLDMFGVQMRPADYVRDLQVLLRPLLYAMLDSPDKRQKEQRKCYQALEALAAIRTTRAQILVLIDLAQGSLDDMRYMRCINDTDHFLIKVIQTVVGLKERGLRIEIALSTTWNEQRGQPLRIRSKCSIEDCMSELRTICTA